MNKGPTIGDWTQYEWIPDDASSFPARVRLRNPAWMVYYEPDAVVQRERAERLELREQNAELRNENAKLRELVAKMAKALGVNSVWCNADCKREFNCNMSDCPIDAALQELGIEVPDA